MRTTRQLFILVSVLTLLAPGVAWSNSAAPIYDTASLSEPTNPQRTPLEIEAETLVFDCVEDAEGEARCTFEATYTVFNPRDVRESTIAAFYGLDVSEVSVSVDGVTSARALSDAEVTTLDASVEAVYEGSGQLDTYHMNYQGESYLETERLQREGFEVSVAGGQRATVVASGVMRPTPERSDSFGPYVMDAVNARHMLVSSVVEYRTYHFEYLIAPIRTWGSVPDQIDVTVRAPADWGYSESNWRDEDHIEALEDTQEADREVTRYAVDPQAERFAFRLDAPVSQIYNGGPLLGIGGTVDDSAGFRMRFGYEFAAPSWMLYSLNVDTDFTDVVILTPVAEAMTPSVMIFGPLGVGLGVPIQVLPEVAVGVRSQVTVGFPAIGFVSTFDVFPGLEESDPLFFQASLMALISI